MMTFSKLYDFSIKFDLAKFGKVIVNHLSNFTAKFTIELLILTKISTLCPKVYYRNKCHTGIII